MNKFFYARLAASNIRKNARVYIPYLLTCIFTVAAFYMIGALSVNPGIEEIELGANSLQITLNLGVWVVALFACIFIFYTHSFLMKRRKKEIGLYNVLGMGKNHLSRVIFYETVYIAAMSLLVGLGLGILLDKAAFLTLASLMKADVPLGFYISLGTIRGAVILFGILFFLIFLNSLRQIHLTNPIELLRGGQVGEKEPKSRWLMALIGVGLLGGGYWIAVTITNPIQAFTLFFVAVIMVILGTYCLFTAGSITMLKLLRKNRRFYYKPNHFIAVSGMIYRMKQNAVGLANICVLSTMVLVMVSTTFSMYIGVEDMMETTYPRDLEYILQGADGNTGELFEEKLHAVLAEENAEMENVYSCTYLNAYSQKINGRYEIDPAKLNNGTAVEEYYTITFLTLETYNRLTGTEKSLEEGEILLYCSGNETVGSVFPLGDEEWRVREQLTEFPDNTSAAVMMTTHLGIVVKDQETLLRLDEMQQWMERNSNLECSYAFDLKGSNPERIERVAEKMAQQFDSLYNEAEKAGESLYYIRYYQKHQEKMLIMSIVSGLLFVGIFLGTLFVMATILIIYYKQISEGYDDKERFTIMEKVGMDKREIRHTIRSQVLTVFFLPLIMAGIHTAFAFPMIGRILQLMALQNQELYILCTVVSFLVFAVLYGIIYSLTARTYYKIVS